MLLPIRSALLIGAALSASSVAPAQVTPPSSTPVATASIPVSDMDQLLDPYRQLEPTPQASEPEPAETPIVDEQPAEAEQTAKPAGSLSEMVAQLRSADPGSRELECLAVGIYFEAKSEPLVGQLAVGEVIANRANSRGRFPSTYCGVLFQRGQFSFVRGGRLPAVARGSLQWRNAVAVARIVDQGLKTSAAEKALFFHAKRVSPGWRLKRVASIGNHIFYR